LLLLDTLNNFKPDFTSEQYELCLNHIFEYAFNSSNQYTQNEAINLYKKVIQLTQSKLLEESMEQIPHKLIKDAKDFIYSHFAEPISLSQIADSLHVSPNYLSKIFHEIVGESYIKFITRIRMEYAARLLKSNSNEKISNVAEKAGYYNWKHFNFVFKEYYNMTPSEYQKS
jgi:two-component system response regulator YesN